MEKTEAIRESINCFKQGGVAYLPSELGWCLCGDPKNEKAVEKLLRISKRKLEEGFFLVPNDRLMYQCVADVPEMAWELIEVSSAPLELILKANRFVHPQLLHHDGCITVRYLKEGILKELSEKFNRPLLSLSMETIDPFKKEEVDFVFPKEYGEKMNRQQVKMIKIAENGTVELIPKRDNS